MRQLIPWQFVYCLLGISSAGLALCKILDDGDGAFTSEGFGKTLQILFAWVWLIGLLVLLPFRIFKPIWDKKHQEEVETKVRSGAIDPSQMVTRRWLAFHAIYGKLPKWLYLPFLAMAMLLTFLTALGIVGAIIWLIIS